MTFGEKLKNTRKNAGISYLEQLAEKLCVSQAAVAKWETDKGLPQPIRKNKFYIGDRQYIRIRYDIAESN